MTSTNQAPTLSTQQKSTNTASADLVPSTPPSVGSVALPSTPASRSSEPSTPYSTGYTRQSDSEIEYSPPMATDLLPGAPMTVDLMILTEYVTSQFLQAGNNGTLPSQAQRYSMQDFLVTGDYGREDMEAGFLHAVSIVCKARNAFNAAVAEVAGAVGEVEVGVEAEGFRAAFSSDMIAWEDVDAETARGLQSVHLQRGVLQAYGAVAALKVGILKVYKRQAETKKRGEGDVEMESEEYAPEEDVSSVKGELGSLDGKVDDRMEVDSVVGV